LSLNFDGGDNAKTIKKAGPQAMSQVASRGDRPVYQLFYGFYFFQQWQVFTGQALIKPCQINFDGGKQAAYFVVNFVSNL
jgi:hypothetical protein